MVTRFLIISILFTFIEHNIFGQELINLPLEVCVGEIVEIDHSISANYYSWNFCVPNVGNAGTSVNLGNPGNLLNTSGYLDFVYDKVSQNYYAFFTNYYQSSIIRLDFGNSPLNTPTATNLGSFGGTLPSQLEGIQIVKHGGNWYGFVVGGQTGSIARLVRLEFGSSLNNSPTAINLGNIGNMSWPHGYQIVNDNGNWFGIVANRNNSRISIHNFGNSPTNTPIGSFFQLQNSTGPSNVMAIKEGADWHVFITSLFHGFTRLDFGNSLSNTPVEVSYGNLNGSLNPLPRGLIILKDCNQFIGYVGHENGIILKLDFGSTLTGTIGVTNIGNPSNAYNKVSDFSPITYNGELLLFSVSSTASTYQRMTIPLCTSSPILSSNDSIPESFFFSEPGHYPISLLANTGRGIQTAICSEITVTDDGGVETLDVVLCQGESHTLPNGTIVSEEGVYIDTLSTSENCINVLITNVIIVDHPEITIVSQTNATCDEPNIGSIELNVSGGAGPPYSYNWAPSLPNTHNPLGLSAGEYFVTVSDANDCTSATSLIIDQTGNYHIPNAFTPNGDGINDFFTIAFSEECTTIQIRSFRIYNRWGKLIYDNPSFGGWDGRHNGTKAPQEVYVYIIELVYENGSVEVLHGDVTLLR